MGLLSPHFTEEELCATRQRGPDGMLIPNAPTGVARMYLRELCATILEPIRVRWGCSVLISSGYRCEKLNELVHGTPGSSHTWGRAADILPGDMTMPLERYFELIVTSGIPYDQALLERMADGRSWIHVSCAPRTRTARRQALTTNDGKAWAT